MGSWRGMRTWSTPTSAVRAVCCAGARSTSTTSNRTAWSRRSPITISPCREGRSRPTLVGPDRPRPLRDGHGERRRLDEPPDRARRRAGAGGFRGTATMLTDGLVFASETLMARMQHDRALEQVRNVACLPGIVGHSLGMPDLHWGYGFPIGGVAGFDPEEGVISPGGVGYDINCGVRLLRSQLDAGSRGEADGEAGRRALRGRAVRRRRGARRPATRRGDAGPVPAGGRTLGRRAGPRRSRRTWSTPRRTGASRAPTPAR